LKLELTNKLFFHPDISQHLLIQLSVRFLLLTGYLFYHLYISQHPSSAIFQAGQPIFNDRAERIHLQDTFFVSSSSRLEALREPLSTIQ